MRLIQNNSGFGLIEAMVTAFIMAIGLLAVVAMQGMAKQSGFEAQQRTLALLLAEEMVERMHIDAAAWLAQGAVSGAVGTGNTPSTPSCANSDGTLSGCDNSGLVQQDVYFWHLDLLNSGDSGSSGLEQPVGCYALTVGGELTVVVSWISRQPLATHTNPPAGIPSDCTGSSNKRRQLVTSSWIAS